MTPQTWTAFIADIALIFALFASAMCVLLWLIAQKLIEANKLAGEALEKIAHYLEDQAK